MITWKGTVTARQKRQGLRLDQVLVRSNFDVFDDAEPESILASVQREHTWPLVAFVGLNPGQIARLILDTGLVRMADPPGGGPPFPLPPDPPPLHDLGDEIAADTGSGLVLLDVSLPQSFGP